MAGFLIFEDIEPSNSTFTVLSYYYASRLLSFVSRCDWQSILNCVFNDRNVLSSRSNKITQFIYNVAIYIF